MVLHWTGCASQAWPGPCKHMRAVSGWGLLKDYGGPEGQTSTDVLQKAYVPIISNSECERRGNRLFRKWEKSLSEWAETLIFDLNTCNIIYIIAASPCAPTNWEGALAKGTLGVPCSLRILKFKVEGLIWIEGTRYVRDLYSHLNFATSDMPYQTKQCGRIRNIL